MTILFPDRETLNSVRDAVSFPAEMNNSIISCAISGEALEDHFRGDNIPRLDTFRANRHAIEIIAERLINQQRFEQDGSILIRMQDC